MPRAGIVFPSALAAFASALALSAAALPAAAENLVEPAYPSDIRDKPLSVNVLTGGAVDNGKVADAAVLYNDGPDAFAAAARAALEESAFDAGRERVTVWYVFRLFQSTKVHDVSRDRGRDLDAEPELVTYVAPVFPPGALSLRTKVALELFLGPDGAVWYAEPAEDGTNPQYVESALAAARKFKFEPATLDGEPTATWYPFVFEFE